jgi:type II secretory ATPase GspE/PulE/Tfp pilus assembly ATPase PilB-like protein
MSMTTCEPNQGISILKRRTAEQHLNDSGPYACLLKDLVMEAKDKKASDIHIEPTENGVEFRIRMDGTIYLYKSIEFIHRESLLLEAKRVFGLSIGVSGRPQDGRVSLSSLRLDLRVSLLPTQYGEKIVLRLLDLDNTFELNQLGYLDNELAVLKSVTQFEDGVVIVSGPTGSGKSRTLYSILNELNPHKYNIVTIEDPIEYRLTGINQVQVNRKMSFSDVLRSCLRQDPDVILVGEIRDSETAKLCFQAAETGHLVFSTLHANGAVEVTERLRNLGVETINLETNLRLSIAQRLEQKLCPECSLVETLSPLKLKIKNEHGCSSCNGGIKGRVPLLEWASYDVNNKNKILQLHQTLTESKKVRVLEGQIDSSGVNFESKK